MPNIGNHPQQKTDRLAAYMTTQMKKVIKEAIALGEQQERERICSFIKRKKASLLGKQPKHRSEREINLEIDILDAILVTIGGGQTEELIRRAK